MRLPPLGGFEAARLAQSDKPKSVLETVPLIACTDRQAQEMKDTFNGDDAGTDEDRLSPEHRAGCRMEI
ncbi:hypothetical protein EVAR_14606_1 [Eumeta japonica]|uniref:Uncharacterized protein n=1 Tax=Eumeta variegata TaxID=151549 RepID=A0A4C1UVP3_EUMVA|nr:hypothetical protein EVAR_14606_1 [Eumeta japonica]